MKKIVVVFGTRPEAIKMCPVVKALRESSAFQTVVCVTGQHREMLRQVLSCFAVTPDYDLDIMQSGQTLFEITQRILTGMREIYEKERPDGVLVHGDTTTAFASALAAFYLGIPVGHVEAGLRTYNIHAPYPEEFNRQAIDSMTTWFFAPTGESRENLLAERKNDAQIYVTGNTSIDALATTVQKEYHHPMLDWAMEGKFVLLTAHRRENWGEPLHAIFRAIRRVLEEHPDVRVLYPVHKNPLVREAAQAELDNHPRIRLIEPLEVLDFHNVMARAHLILTDSGGIQEEASALGKPVLVLRETTERPEGVAAGALKLVGTQEQRVYEAFTQLLEDPEEYHRMCSATNSYGDGTASLQIVQILQKTLH